MNQTLVVKHLFQSKSAKGTDLDTEKTETEKSQQGGQKKSDLFCADSGARSFHSNTEDDWIQCTEFEV
jgi:hypothetical protein